jgi:predicted transcriptional regulator
MAPTDSNNILPPEQMNAMRTCSGLSFRDLWRATRISCAQLCDYENGKTNLRDDQLRACERVLLRAVRERERQIATLLSSSRVATGRASVSA